MAQLLDWLAFSGARDSSGNPVSSGQIWFYQPGGGTSPAAIYADVDGSIAAGNPTTLDAAGRAEVYVTDPVRIVIQDAHGVTISDYDQADVHRAENVQVENSGFNEGYLDDVLTDIYTSTGGVDAQYQESGGATPRTIRAKFSELSISVKDFGAKGDGLTIDTTACQAAINRVMFLGGGVVYFPPGTYLVDLSLTLVSAVGVHLIGAGSTASVIKNTSGIGNAITYSTAGSSCSIERLKVTASAASTGIGIDLGNQQGMVLDSVDVAGHYTAISSSFGSNLTFRNTTGAPPVASAGTGRGLVLSTVSVALLVGGAFTSSGSSFGLDLQGGTLLVTSVGTEYDFINFDSTLSGYHYNFINPGAMIPTFAGTTMPSGYRVAGQVGAAGQDGYKGGLLTGGTFTPALFNGFNITIDATTTGSGYTIAAPTPPPAVDDYGMYMTLTFWAHAGGAITGWGVDTSKYKLSATPTTTDTHKTTYRLHWDPDNSVWREVSRSDTT